MAAGVDLAKGANAMRPLRPRHSPHLASSWSMPSAAVRLTLAPSGGIARRRLKRGVFHSLVDRQAAINRYLVEHNQAPRLFVWTAEPEAILAKIKRGHQTLETVHQRQATTEPPRPCRRLRGRPRHRLERSWPRQVGSAPSPAISGCASVTTSSCRCQRKRAVADGNPSDATTCGVQTGAARR